MSMGGPFNLKFLLLLRYSDLYSNYGQERPDHNIFRLWTHNCISLDNEGKNEYVKEEGMDGDVEE
jgi:hypothetical protein